MGKLNSGRNTGNIQAKATRIVETTKGTMLIVGRAGASLANMYYIDEFNQICTIASSNDDAVAVTYNEGILSIENKLSVVLSYSVFTI